MALSSNAPTLRRACAFLSAMGHLVTSGKRSDTETFRVAEEFSGRSFSVAMYQAEGGLDCYSCMPARSDRH